MDGGRISAGLTNHRSEFNCREKLEKDCCLKFNKHIVCEVTKLSENLILYCKIGYFLYCLGTFSCYVQYSYKNVFVIVVRRRA